MTGMFMLYVAIIVSVPRKNQSHPHGLRHAWSWLAATINLGELRKNVIPELGARRSQV